MNQNMKSSLWPKAMTAVRECHLSLLSSDAPDAEAWKEAFSLVLDAIEEERKAQPDFASELYALNEETGVEYAFEDIFEEYFDLLEKEDRWEDVIASSERMIKAFAWKDKAPSEYMFRKGNALEHLKRYDEAAAFGKEWLEQYPDDLYAAASNTFLAIETGRLEEAKAIVEKYMREELVCDDTNDTFFMAAFRLYEMTDNIYAKQRVEQKMAEYSRLISQ